MTLQKQANRVVLYRSNLQALHCIRVQGTQDLSPRAYTKNFHLIKGESQSVSSKAEQDTFLSLQLKPAAGGVHYNENQLLSVSVLGLTESKKWLDLSPCSTRPVNSPLSGTVVIGWWVTVLNWKWADFNKVLGRNFLLWGWWDTGTGCPEELRMPHPWKCSRLRLDGTLSNLI